MKFDTRAPCSSCPYRQDVPAGTWHRDEFVQLLKNDADPHRGAVFGCHKGKRAEPEKMQVCGGWLLDQKKRGIPSIGLRIDMIAKPEAVKALDEITDGGAPVYPSIAAMCRANGVRAKRPRQMSARQAIRILLGGKA